MKIKKFKESLEPTKKFHICIVANWMSEADYSGIFNTEEDLNNWLLNIINDSYIDSYLGDDEPELFLEMNDAIKWFKDKNECNVFIDNEAIYNNNTIKLKHNIETLRQTTKFNI